MAVNKQHEAGCEASCGSGSRSEAGFDDPKGRIEWISTVVDGFDYGERWVIKDGYPFRIFKLTDTEWEGHSREGFERFPNIRQAAAYVEQMYKASRQAYP